MKPSEKAVKAALPPPPEALPEAAKPSSAEVGPPAKKKKIFKEIPDAFAVISEAIKVDQVIVSSLKAQDLKNFSGFSKYDEKGFSFGVLDTLPVPKVTSELNCLAEAIYFEARGESLEGQ